MKKIYHANTSQKKAGIAIGISDKADSKIRNIIKSKKRQIIVIKGSIYQKDIIFLNMYAEFQNT